MAHQFLCSCDEKGVDGIRFSEAVHFLFFAALFRITDESFDEKTAARDKSGQHVRFGSVLTSNKLLVMACIA